MGKLLRIRVNMARLRENLSDADGRSWSEAEVERWLQDARFVPAMAHWIVREPDLGQLEADEVLGIEDCGS